MSGNILGAELWPYLLHTTVYCIILYYTTLAYTDLYWIILYYIILCCIVIYYTIRYYTILQYTILCIVYKLSNLIHFGITFVEHERIAAYICRTWFIGDLHFSNLPSLRTTFVETDSCWIYICRTSRILEFNYICRTRTNFNFHLSNLFHFGFWFLQLDFF